MPVPRSARTSGTGWRRPSGSSPGSFDDDESFDALAAELIRLEDSHGIAGNAAFYLSIPPAMFPHGAQADASYGHGRQHRPRRLAAGRRREAVRPRPRRRAAPSTRSSTRSSRPQDVFRIDHYLGKETVQNVLALRTANELFEPLWNAHHIDSIQITMAEDVGISGRAGFYDSAGAARDVLQNHLLQLLALVAMEEPVSFGAEALRREKIKALGAISLPDNLERYAVRGQYDVGWLGGDRVVGYTDEKDVPPDSRTETYAAVKVGVETRRWAGVPFYLRTGKRLPKRVTEIAVIFKRAPHTPFSANDVDELGKNQLVIRVQPDEGVTLRFGSKVPGTTMEVRDVAMDFAYGASFTESSPEAYERLILDVMLGDKTLFPNHEEVEMSWKVIDPLEDYWANTTPQKYAGGTWGPAKADEMLAVDGRNWSRP